MTDELVKCPCCDKMVPVDDVELTFRKPDDIAVLDDDEFDEKCRCTNDVCVYDDEYFYVRCVLPLPVHDKGTDYCLGVWVQVSEKSYSRIWDLWDNEDQQNEPPIRGLLANNVPLTSGTSNIEVSVQLTGATSRPTVAVKDETCSLYKEQTCGITIHRASEYSDICR